LFTQVLHDGSDDDSRGQDDADEEDEYTLPKWLADAVKGDSCMLAWGAYLTYGVEATGKLVDSFLKLHDERKRLLADNEDVPKALKENIKSVLKLICCMLERKAMEVFRTLHAIKHRQLDELHDELLDRCRHKKYRGSADDQLACWLVINDALVAAGWPQGLFATNAAKELLQSRSSAEWEAPENAAERQRTEKVVNKLKGIEQHCQPYSISMKRIGDIIAAHTRNCRGFRLELTSFVTPGVGEQWILLRCGVLWPWLDTSPEPEWLAFFNNHWRDGTGYYTPVNNVRPTPRV
jgi:hypothetical protein